MRAIEADMYPRLHFGKGDPLDLLEPVNEWDRESFEQEWREVGVRVEWLKSPRGRLDRALAVETPEVIVTPTVDNSDR